MISTLLILPLLLEGRLGMNVLDNFRSSYTLETEGYKWDDALAKIIPTGEGNYLEEIDKHLIHHTIDYNTRNKYYKNEDHGGYAINVGSFDIAGALRRSHLMKDDNASLLTISIQKNYMDITIT